MEAEEDEGYLAGDEWEEKMAGPQDTNMLHI
jgi:hypothetical protein